MAPFGPKPTKHQRKLFSLAKAVAKKAHAPYSKFKVGAALVDEKGRYFTGCNVENSSYGGTICAERNAIAAMVAAGGRCIHEILVITDTPEGCRPCGICRQSIQEFAATPSQTLVHVATKTSVKSTMTIADLLPHAFTSKFLKTLVIGALIFLTTSCSVFKGSTPARKVVIISIDGMRPDFFKNEAYDTPTLKSLVKRGASTDTLISVYPSVTYPSHTSLVTGTTPADHGILSNTIFSPETGSTPLWYWEASHIRAPTLWQRAKAEGKTVGILRWPATAGAQVDWLIPEIFSIPGIHKETDVERTIHNSTPELVKEVFSDIDPEILHSHTMPDPRLVDQWTFKATLYLLKKHSPDLMLVHFSSVDQAQHRASIDSAHVKQAIHEIDTHLKKIVDKIDFNRTVLIVVGDHGFANYKKHININAMFAHEGLLQVRRGKIKDWQATAHLDGGAAAVYVKDEKLHGKIAEFLKAQSKDRFHIIERSEFLPWGTNPQASFMIEANDNYIFSPTLQGPAVTVAPQTLGSHGYLPTKQKMFTGLIAVGPGIASKKTIKQARLIDIAPTAARYLKISLPHTEGDVIEDLF